MTDANPYRGAYPRLASRRGVWKEIARFVRRDAPTADTLVELGPGYCDFINQFPARRKIGFELNAEMAAYAGSDVELRIESAVELSDVLPRTVDLVFASNFLEHLAEKELQVLLSNVRRVLVPGGRLILLQPNYRLCPDRYFDDPTHQTVFDDRNIGAWLSRHGLRVVRLVPGLLPFSMQSRSPKWPILVRMYLHCPIRPWAAQMYVVAERS